MRDKSTNRAFFNDGAKVDAALKSMKIDLAEGLKRGQACAVAYQALGF